MTGSLADSTEGIRGEMMNIINTNPAERKELEIIYGQVWDTKELTRDFEVHSFLAPFVFVTRKTGLRRRGTLMFQHSPRYYFSWKED